MYQDLNDIICYKKNYGNDNIYYKEIIKKKLINNHNLIVAIDNPDLDPDSPEDYIGINILPFYFLSDKTQTTAQNYICFETSFTEVHRYNDIVKQGQIIFYILADIRNIYDDKTGISRHDLIAALIEDEFNWCTDFGTRLKLVQDKPYAVDNNYVLRTLIFEQDALNGITEARTQEIINNDR